MLARLEPQLLGDLAPARSSRRLPGFDEPAGDLVQLRPLADEDLPLLSTWWHDVEHAPLQRGVVAPGPLCSAAEAFRSWSANDGKTPDVGFSVVEASTGELAGHLTLWGSSWWRRSAELSIMIGPGHQGRGLGPDAVGVALRLAFDELGLHRVSLAVWAFNDRALAAYRRAGFTEEGRLREVGFHAGSWHDEVLMAVLEREWRARRATPITSPCGPGAAGRRRRTRPRAR